MFVRSFQLTPILRASIPPRRSSRAVSESRRPRLSLERLEARTLLNAGDLAPTFGTGGQVLTDFIGSVPALAEATVIQPDGKIIVAGNGQTGSNRADFLLARYNPDGTLDTSFGTGGRVNTEFMAASAGARLADVALQQDGKILVVGGAGDPAIPNSLNFVVARYNADETAHQPHAAHRGYQLVGSVPQYHKPRLRCDVAGRRPEFECGTTYGDPPKR